ncbi:MAG: hypothetical protein RR131_07200 [Anaerovorax sp.]
MGEDCKQCYDRDHGHNDYDCHKPACKPCCDICCDPCDDGWDWITWVLIIAVIFLLCSPKNGNGGFLGGLFG